MENEVTFLSHRKMGTPVWVSSRSTQVRLCRAGEGCRRRAVGGHRRGSWQERGVGRGSAGRRGTHVTLIDSPGGRRAGASGARSLSENPCSHLLALSRPGKLSLGDQQPSPFAYTWAHPFPSDLMGETETCWEPPGSGESLSSSLGIWSDLTSLPQFTHL